MVDRIVPATTAADRAAVARLGYEDAWPVVAEPFSQWVIEDRFVRGRPAWEEAGAEIVQDVRPYELMKLRALNGAHSSLAYLGAVAGLETVADAMADPALPPFLRALWDEDLVPVIPTVRGMDLPAYTAELVARFRNPAIRHRLLQIAMDGSQKLPQRLLRPALDRLRQGAMPHRIALVVAAWMRFLQGRDERGRPYEVNDPLAPRLHGPRVGGGRRCEKTRRLLCSACTKSSRRSWLRMTASAPKWCGRSVRCCGTACGDRFLEQHERRDRNDAGNVALVRAGRQGSARRMCGRRARAAW